MAPSVPLETRISQLEAFASKHGHMFVPQSFKEDGLGVWVKNIKAKKGKLDPKDIAKLDQIGFVWVTPTGPAKEEIIQWGKQFSLLVDFYKEKQHCQVPQTIGGENNPIFEWCEEQRRLYAKKKLDQGKIDKLKNISFDFYSSEPHKDVNEEESVSNVLRASQSLLMTSTSPHARTSLFPLDPPNVLRVQPSKRRRVSDDFEQEMAAMRDEIHALHDEIMALKQDNMSMESEIFSLKKLVESQK